MTRARSDALARDQGSLWIGFVAALAANASVVALFQLLRASHPSVRAFGLMVLGFGQFLYLGPIAVALAQYGRARTAKGVWLAAGLTALAYVGCAGFAVYALSTHEGPY